jgi:hypothetical protein
LLNEAILGNKKSVSIPDSVLSELEFKRKQYFEKELAFDRLYTLRATSQVLEMGGRFEEAFESYKETIIFAVTSRHIPLNAYLLDINRFRFLCNKLKRKKEYENVIARYKIPV